METQILILTPEQSINQIYGVVEAIKLLHRTTWLNLCVGTTDIYFENTVRKTKSDTIDRASLQAMSTADMTAKIVEFANMKNVWSWNTPI